jgi:hypothetical protein
MAKIITCAVLGASVLLLGGCFPFRRPVEPQQLSLKDDVAKPPRGAAETPLKPKPTLAVDDKARAEQWERCAQRHVDYQAGRLNETVEEKRMRDEICAELHRTDHARQ